MKWLLKSPSLDDLIRVLYAWRLWLAGAFLGCLAALLVYWIFPPPYRAQATVLIDHNVEDVIPDETHEHNRFYYLQQESDKLIQIAWSDDVLAAVAAQAGVSLADLRGGMLRLSQPEDGGWHFIAESADPAAVSPLAAAWAQAFYARLQEGGAGISPAMEYSLVQVEGLAVERAIPAGTYAFFGSLAGAAGLAFIVLFINRREG